MTTLAIPGESYSESSSYVSIRNRTDADFQDFCEGEQDLMLKYLENESLLPSSSVRTPYANAVRYENTYRMEPTKKFFPGKVEEIIGNVLREGLEDVKYEPTHCAQYTRELSETIKERVKQLDVPRYKLVCFVCIGQLQGQGVRIGSRCVWNAKSDNYASSIFKNKSLFAVGTVFAVYLE